MSFRNDPGSLDDELLDDLLSWKAPTSSTSEPTRVGGLAVPARAVNVTMGLGSVTPEGKALSPTTGPQASASSAATAPAEPALELPHDLQERLFAHQLEGVQWLYRKHRHARACLLADEMGLGKTIQVSVFLGQLYRQQAIKTTIIVLPPTLVPMWERTLLEWGRLPRNTIEVVHRESKAKRASHWKKLTFGLPRVMITTYGVLRQDASEMSVSMVDYVVLDEAHVIKNADTDASKAAQKLSTRHKIALTGTPLMNNFRDLWAIFEFMDGDIISMSRHNFGKVNACLLSGNEQDASAQVRRAATETLARLQAAIQPYMLRREKKDVGVVDSTKHDTVVWVTLSAVQEQLYRAVLSEDGRQAATDATDSSSASVEQGGTDGEVGGNPSGALVQVTTLSQVCNHPWLQLTERAFREAVERPVSAGAVCEEVGDIHSGKKLGVALTLLQRCVADDRKVLVFSRSKMLLTIFSRLLTDQRVTHARIDGDISNISERMRAVDAFNEDPTVKACLLTTQVGGVGLTFRSASCVILLDPSWNPAADSQAMDRVHRIGQERSDVYMFRLVTSGTIEEKIYRNQVFKTMAAKQTTRNTQEEPDQFFRYFTHMQLRDMFTLGDLTTSETATQLLKLHPAGVDPRVTALTCDVPGVCGISDNGRVLNESVVTPPEEEEDEEEEPPSSSPRAADDDAQCDSLVTQGKEETIAEPEEAWRPVAPSQHASRLSPPLPVSGGAQKRQRSPGDTPPRAAPGTDVETNIDDNIPAPVVDDMNDASGVTVAVTVAAEACTAIATPSATTHEEEGSEDGWAVGDEEHALVLSPHLSPPSSPQRDSSIASSASFQECESDPRSTPTSVLEVAERDGERVEY